MNFLIIEDQLTLREIIAQALSQSGFNVLAFETAEAFYAQQIELENIQVAIVDISLPGMSGLEFARQLREVGSHLGIIILTMHKTIEHKLKGYQAGADLYLTKPIDSEELLAACKALVNRLGSPLLDSDAKLLLDGLKQKILYGSKTLVTLSFKETRMLQAFLKAPEQQLEYWQLLELNKLSFDDKGRKQLEVAISRLRHKLTAIDPGIKAIQANRGFGYQLMLPMQLG